MDSGRILILYITPHSGHHRAAIAIERAIQETDSNIQTICLDAFNYTNPILNKIVHKTYLQIIRKKPEVWEYLYDNPQIVLKTQRLKRLIHKYNSRKLLNLLSESQPDVVISTQAFPCGMIADLKKYHGIDLPLIGVLTDYVAHSFWYYDKVDLYIVPDISSKLKMVQNGIPESRIRIYGIPIGPEFNSGLDKQKVRRELEFELEKPLILIMGGGRGIGEIKQILNHLSRLDLDLQLVAVCGMNKRLYRYLKKKEDKLSRNKRVKILGYVENINQLMAGADLLISKPGGITTAEALASGLPMIIFSPLPGQERCNLEFLLKTGAAIKCEKISVLSVLVRELLLNREKLKFMSQNAIKYARRDSSLRIAQEAIGFIPKVYV